MRPLQAVIFVLLYFLIALLGNYILYLEILNILFEVLVAVIFIFFPMVINGMMITIHNHNSGVLLNKSGLELEIAETVSDLIS